MNITPDCDCESISDSYIVKDIGILASDDPVAIDTASYHVNEHMVFNGSEIHSNWEKVEDKFGGIWFDVDGWTQLKYAQKIGLGSMNYELIKI